MKKQNRGFTFIELLLYVATVSTMIFVVSYLWYLLMAARVKNQTVAEVERQGAQAILVISQVVRSAQSINSPFNGASAGTLSLSMADASKNPTIVDLSGGAIRITEGSGSATALTSSRLTVTGLTFINLSATGTPGIIRTQATVTQVNPSGVNEYDYTQTFYGSTSIR